MSGVILVRARILIRRRLAVSIRLRFVSAAASATIYRLAASSSSSCLSTTASIFKNKVPPQPPASGIVGSSSPVLSSLMANISNGIHVQNQVNDEDQCDKLLSVMSLKAAGTQPGSPLSNSTCPRQKDHSRHPSSVHSIIVNGMNGQWEDSVGVGKASWKPFLIGVAGGTASGKTSVCHSIMQKLGQNDLAHDQRHVVTISSDSFYRILNVEERERAKLGEFDFDHPDALDFELISRTMRTLLAGKVARFHVYDFVTHSRLPNEYIHVHPADVVLFEGILVFYFPELRNLFQLKLFVDTDADTRLARRVVRDLRDRGRDLPSVLHQYTLFVKPAFEEFCQPTKKYADVIIPRGSENEVAINLIVQHIKEHLLPLAMENGSPRRSKADQSIQRKVKQRQMQLSATAAAAVNSSFNGER